MGVDILVAARFDGKHQRINDAFIDLDEIAKQFNVLQMAQLIGLLEAPQQIPQRRQHLIGQGIAHHRLEAAALFEHIAQAVAIGIEEHMALPQQ